MTYEKMIRYTIQVNTSKNIEKSCSDYKIRKLSTNR